MSEQSRQKQIKHGREHWQAHMEAWQRSGLSRAAYCRQHGINKNTFAYWRHRLKENAAPVKLVQLPTGTVKQAEKASLRLVVNDRISIDVSDGFQPETLSRVLEVVRGL